MLIILVHSPQWIFYPPLQNALHCYGAFLWLSNDVLHVAAWSIKKTKQKKNQFYYLLHSKLHVHKNSTRLMNKVVYLTEKSQAYFSEDLLERKTKQIRELRLHLYSSGGHKHHCEWMLMLFM